jgi:uncharacterized repeat protein (TIGR02543 family)
MVVVLVVVYLLLRVVLFVMSYGIIFNNTAISGMRGGGIGGGVCVNGSFVMSGGVVANNKAYVNGGGVWVTNTNTVVDFGRLFIGEGVVFSNNRAGLAYNRASVHDAVYAAQIKATSWSSPFTQGYNNYDISYTYGEPVAFYNVTVSGSYAATTGAGSYLTGTSVVVNAGSRDGYTFSGWTVNEGGITLSNSAAATFTMPARNVVLTANWTSASTGDGGSGGGSSPKPSPSTSTPSELKPTTPVPRPSEPEIIVDPISTVSFSLVVVLIVGAALVVITIVVLLLHRDD